MVLPAVEAECILAPRGKRKPSVGAWRPTGGNPSHPSVDAMGLHEGNLAPRGQRSSSEGGSDLLVIAAKVAGFGRPLRVLVDSGASKNHARRQTMAENARLLAQACARDRGLISVRLATGVVATVKTVELD
ncbi:TPA: hypothetical protein N0F65_010832 [Lagenidium giganteum]|uniref:Uncharacterized protein n=1 Tax=Lagenidium giganteum TaxID=4803 RepID=A0AAV2Z669_9STRA|nr:TPA: hypothetical protein N0F65_010832 [Lagenidium giganteum]